MKVNSEIFFLHVGGYEGMQTCIKVNEKKYLFNGKGRTSVTFLFVIPFFSFHVCCSHFKWPGCVPTVWPMTSPTSTTRGWERCGFRPHTNAVFNMHVWKGKQSEDTLSVWNRSEKSEKAKMQLEASKFWAKVKTQWKPTARCSRQVEPGQISHTAPHTCRHDGWFCLWWSQFALVNGCTIKYNHVKTTS